MARDANIPLFLWVATAALVHIISGFEAEKISAAIESRENVRRFAASVKQYVRHENTTLEVSFMDESELSRLESERSQRGAVEPEEPEPSELEESDPSDEQARDAKPTETDPEKVELQPEPPKPKEREKERKTEEKKVAEVTVVPNDDKRRVAVRQQSADANQPDNPNAEFMADEANHVERETQARITSSDQNSAVPNPGTNIAPPSDAPGNARLTELGQSDDSPGATDRAAAESPEDGKDDDVQQAQVGARPGHLQGGEPARVSPGENPDSTRQAKEESVGREARAHSDAREESPELLDSPGGTDVVGGPSDAATERKAQIASKRQKATPNARKTLDLRGFGSMNTTPGGLNPNLNPSLAVAVIGADQLSRERRADGERRRSKHRGSWASVGLEKWKSAIENYVATVQPGNQTALNTARRPFASYLNRIHQRLHPEFADDFLGSLSSLPSDHGLNQQLQTNLEIVLSREDGRVVRMGVTRASGNTAFDVGALESVQRAAPFGAPPSEIVSPDGNVYLHWEFHRNPMYACSTYFARPYILRVAPTPAPLPEVPTPPAQPEETEMAPQRHGERAVTKTKQNG